MVGETHPGTPTGDLTGRSQRDGDRHWGSFSCKVGFLPRPRSELRNSTRGRTNRSTEVVGAPLGPSSYASSGLVRTTLRSAVSGRGVRAAGRLRRPLVSLPVDRGGISVWYPSRRGLVCFSVTYPCPSLGPRPFDGRFRAPPPKHGSQKTEDVPRPLLSSSDPTPANVFAGVSRYDYSTRGGPVLCVPGRQWEGRCGRWESRGESKTE